ERAGQRVWVASNGVGDTGRVRREGRHLPHHTRLNAYNIVLLVISTAQRRFRALDRQCGPWASITWRNCVSRSLMMARLRSSHSRSLIEDRAGGSMGWSGSWI